MKLKRASDGTIYSCHRSAMTLSCDYRWSSAPRQDKAAVDRLYNAAKKEGTVVIWGPTDAIIYQRMQEALDKQVPRYQDRALRKYSRAAGAKNHRRKPGRQAGRGRYHSVRFAAGARPLIDRDMLAPFPGWEKDFGLDAVYANQRFVGAYNLTLPISYNTKMVSAKDAPKSWEDLADPKWKDGK